MTMHSTSLRRAAVVAAAVAALAGCDRPGTEGGGEGAPTQPMGRAPLPSPPPAAAAKTPQEAMTRLVGSIADDDGRAACALMIEAAQVAFVQEVGVGPDCPGTVSIISSALTDREAYRSMKPAGMKVKGAWAEISGYCRHGWTKADGSYDSSDNDPTPNDLGTFYLRRYDEGWRIYTFRGSKRYSSCG